VKLRSLPRALAVNGLLTLLAVFALFPLVWMVSVSFMQAGEASSFPPPLLPAKPSIGSVTSLNWRQRPAPSMRAASYSSCGIACSAAMKMIMLAPKPFHTENRMIDGIAQSGSPSQSIGPRPKLPSQALSIP